MIKRLHITLYLFKCWCICRIIPRNIKICTRAGAKFNGVLCGRATWSGAVKVYIEQGEEAAREWLRTTGFKNIDDLNKVLETTATSWKSK